MTKIIEINFFLRMILTKAYVFGSIQKTRSLLFL